MHSFILQGAAPNIRHPAFATSSGLSLNVTINTILGFTEHYFDYC